MQNKSKINYFFLKQYLKKEWSKMLPNVINGYPMDECDDIMYEYYVESMYNFGLNEMHIKTVLNELGYKE